jgi:hypothetical protein
LLLTNDGEVANAIISAATHLPKTYLKATGADGRPGRAFRNGIPDRAAAANIRLRIGREPWYEVGCLRAARTRSADVYTWPLWKS